MSNGKIFILSGGSGSGKTTLRDMLIKKIDNLEKIITMTSRPPRGDEVHEIDYYFVTREEINDLKSNGRMVETAEIYNNYYGTPLYEIESNIYRGKHIILIVDVAGKINIDKLYKSVSIYITPPSTESQLMRLQARNKKTLSDIETRSKLCNEEFHNALVNGNYTHYIDGESDIDSCFNELCNIITSVIGTNE